MERLTAIEKGYAYYPKCFEEPCNGNGCTNDECEMHQNICEKLAKYEDTGLEPEVCAEYKKFENECVGKNVTFPNILKIIERLRTGGWISVSCDDIKNPKDEQIVIGCRNNGEIAIYQFNWWDDVVGAFYRVDKYSKEVESERMWDDEVIAWQPLPEPYKPMQEGGAE